MAPRDHRIHLGRMDSPESSPQNHSSAKICFSGPQKTSPGQNVDLGVPKSDPGLQNLSPGMKKQKMRAEKPCRTPPSKNQTEPYSASYGQKPFWGCLSKSWCMQGAIREGKMILHCKIMEICKNSIIFKRTDVFLRVTLSLHCKNQLKSAPRQRLRSGGEFMGASKQHRQDPYR